MIKKTVPYVDYNGNSKTFTAYFHMNKRELVRFSAPFGGSPDKLQAYINKIVNKDDLTELVDFVEKIILDSYGIKSEDGSKFEKSPAIREEYSNSEPYAELFAQLMQDPNEANNFFTSIVGAAQAEPVVQPTIATIPQAQAQTVDSLIQQGQPAQSTPVAEMQGNFGGVQDPNIIPGSPAWNPGQ